MRGARILLAASLALAGCASTTPEETLEGIRGAYGLPASAGALRLAFAEVSPEGVTFHYEQEGGAARAWILLIPIPEREQRPDRYADLDAVLASIREGKPDFRVRERKPVPEGPERIWSCATYTWGGSDAPRHGAVAVALRPAGGGLRAWVVHATRAGEGALEDALALLSAAAR